MDGTIATIGVTDFGPIREAEIDLKPLTIFTGPANSGKTFMAELVFALHHACHDATLRDAIGSIGDMEPPIAITLNGKAVGDGPGIAGAHPVQHNRHYWLPADRAAYTKFPRALITTCSDIDPYSPLGNFIEDLLVCSEPRGERNRLIEKIALDMETELLGQEVFGHDDSNDCLGYRERGERYRMTAGSEATASLAALILLIRNQIQPGENIIIDLPEHGLHPEAQVILTRYLARLAARGVNVLAITHSEWMLEELVNVIERYNRGHGYFSLAEDNVAVYEFPAREHPDKKVTRASLIDGLFHTEFQSVASSLHNEWADLRGHEND